MLVHEFLTKSKKKRCYFSVSRFIFSDKLVYKIENVLDLLLH